MENHLWLTPLIALVVSFFTSMAGVSGAFLLLPIQMSIFQFTSPAVSATNLVFNLVATPAAVYHYWREKRILWPLGILVVAGTTPGVILGCLARIAWFPDPRRFKVFVALVLLGIGLRLALDIWKSRSQTPRLSSQDAWQTRTIEFQPRRFAFVFQHHTYQCRPTGILVLSLAIGLIGGIYGIGGAAIMAPFLVAIYGLPVHTIAGATLLGTLATSLVGVTFYQVIAPLYPATAVAPHWTLGLSYGIGGIAGMYLGARTQRFVSPIALKLLLLLTLLAVALPYLRNNL